MFPIEVILAIHRKCEIPCTIGWGLPTVANPHMQVI